MSVFDEIYAEAGAATGRDPDWLRVQAVQVFGTMLMHAMQNEGSPIWTVTRIASGRLDIEVNTFPRVAGKVLGREWNEMPEVSRIECMDCRADMDGNHLPYCAEAE
jgi:hypothetical protein